MEHKPDYLRKSQAERERLAKLRAEDLRGAAALLTASMMAEGESELTGLCHLLRGYEKPEQNLKNLGASIKSVDIPAPFVYNT